MKEKINLSWVTRGYYMLKKAQFRAIKTKGSKVTWHRSAAKHWRHHNPML